MALGDPAAPVRAVTLTVLTAPGCPHCAHVVTLARDFAAARPGVVVQVHDVHAAPELATRYGVRAVPVLVIDDAVALCGEIPAARLAAVVAALGTPALATERLRALCENRRLDAVVDYLLAGVELEAMVPLLRDGDLALRVAVLLAVEEAAARDRGALAALVPHFVPLLASPDRRLRGDVCDALGTIGDPGAAAPLRALLDDPDSEVVAAAGDALARLAPSA